MEAVTTLLDEQAELYNKTRKYVHLLRWYEILKLAKDIEKMKVFENESLNEGAIKECRYIISNANGRYWIGLNGNEAIDMLLKENEKRKRLTK